MARRDEGSQPRWEFWAKVLIPLVAVVAAVFGSVLGAWMTQRNLEETFEERREEVRADRVQAAADAVLDAGVRARKAAQVNFAEWRRLVEVSAPPAKRREFDEEWQRITNSNETEYQAALARFRLVVEPEVYERHLDEVVGTWIDRDRSIHGSDEWLLYIDYLKSVEERVVTAYRESVTEDDK